MINRDGIQFPDRPGRSTIEAALVSGDAGLLRKIAAERKGLTDQQRNALSLVADLLNGTNAAAVTLSCVVTCVTFHRDKIKNEIVSRWPTAILSPFFSLLRDVEGARMRLQVHCYAGRRADEKPVRFRVDEHEYLVEEVVDQWYGPEDVFFKVRADDGNLYILRHRTAVPVGIWDLVAFRQTRQQ